MPMAARAVRLPLLLVALAASALRPYLRVYPEGCVLPSTPSPKRRPRVRSGTPPPSSPKLVVAEAVSPLPRIPSGQASTFLEASVPI